MRKLRHNDIVLAQRDGGWKMFGRVWRRIDTEHVQVIDDGLYIRILKDSELTLRNDYKGFVNHEGRFVRMTTLRKLKKNARVYNPHFGGKSWMTGKRWTKAQRAKALACGVGQSFWDDEE